MGTWKECKNCGNGNAEDMIYLCKEDNFVFCQDCGDKAPNSHGNHNCICPVCESTSDVRILGEIDPDAYEGDNKCENCGNVDGSDMLYRCTNDDLLFCQECGDKTYNIHGNHNCICPVCHSTSDVKILGEIDESDDDDDDNYSSSSNKDDDDDDNSSSSSSSTSSSGGCFITTACVTFKGLADNCYELQTLRHFRDNYMLAIANGNAELNHYYKISPYIIKKINNRKDASLIWEKVHREIQKSVRLIEKGEEKDAYKIYKKIVKDLLKL